ncbi:MAG: archaetidylserine decarboxylase [Planctomycetota bacterium]|nr:archaetidylserine decarboxylase [Planctomycetota bacterium]
MERKPPLIVRILPRRGLSRLTGWFAKRRVPGFLLRPMLRAYATRYGANLEESARPLEDFKGFTDFFTRKLKDGVRPMPADPHAIACPCDGTAAMAGTVEDGLLLQVKGHSYTLAELLGDAEEATAFEGGTYAVLYLAPGDYHRYHWPFAGHLDTLRHVRGDLWPVNERAVASVEKLFAVNERVVCLGNVPSGARFAYIPVGALNVGSIKLAFHELTTNRRSKVAAQRWPIAVDAARGDEFGLFELGSTVVLVLAREAGTLTPPPPGTKIRVGEPIGTLAP